MTVAPAATATGAAAAPAAPAAPATLKKPPPIPPTTATPAATMIESPLLTVVVACGALEVAVDETGALVMVAGSVVGGADVGSVEGRTVVAVIGGRYGAPEDGMALPAGAEVRFG